MVVFYYKDAHGKASFSSAHQRCTGSTAQTCPSSCFIMAYPDDKSMTKFDGNAHSPVISRNYTCATDELKEKRRFSHDWSTSHPRERGSRAHRRSRTCRSTAPVRRPLVPSPQPERSSSTAPSIPARVRPGIIRKFETHEAVVIYMLGKVKRFS